MFRWLIITLPLAIVLAPLALRPAPPPAAASQVIVVTPHGEAIRSEFGRAFRVWARRELGAEVGVDWRTPGGTADIERYCDAQYTAAFRRRFPELPDQGFNDPNADPATPARAAFLAGDEVGCGLDVFFGGGEFKHRQQAAKGYLVDAGLLRERPEWFDPAIIPADLSGERMYDPQGRYYGACLSAFGIAVNRQRAAALGLEGGIASWEILGDPRLAGAVGFADPGKSAVASTVIERIIQRRIAAAAADPAAPTAEEFARGWDDAWTLVKRIVGNARSVADGASRAVREAARGDTAAVMCIDFHARAEAEWAQATAGDARIDFVAPAGGTGVSADPIALLRGAPNRDLGVAFIRFVLSPEGQRLWNQRVGTPGGPERYAIRRLPIRRDRYTAEDRALMSDPEVDPFALAGGFTYRPAWTGPVYSLIAPLTRAIALDPRDELVAAWRAILVAGGPERVPEAWAVFRRLPVAYADAKTVAAELRKGGPPALLPRLRTWTDAAMAQYREARALAEAGR